MRGAETDGLITAARVAFAHRRVDAQRALLESMGADDAGLLSAKRLLGELRYSAALAEIGHVLLWDNLLGDESYAHPSAYEPRHYQTDRG